MEAARSASALQRSRSSALIKQAADARSGTVSNVVTVSMAVSGWLLVGPVAGDVEGK